MLPASTGSSSASAPVANVLTVDVEDWFHILELEATPSPARWEALESRVEVNFRRLLDLFGASGTRVTCFFLGWVGERFPHLVRLAAEQGHEIACHGYGHQLVYTQSRDEFRADIRKAKGILEDIACVPVRGYRAPGFSVTAATPWAFEEIARAGFAYDSSVFPARRGHGGMQGAQLGTHDIRTPCGTLTEFPATVVDFRLFRMCFFGGGYLRLFPYPLIREMSRAVNRSGRTVIYYIHPREIDPTHPRLPMPPVRAFKSYVNLDSTARKLERIARERPLARLCDLVH
jgi:polysaccharide deacetylase family protein (PEP-CTERM system associated)